jgi:hypothetical protein
MIPRIFLAGSPGMRWSIRNTINNTIKKTGIISRNLLSAYFSRLIVHATLINRASLPDPFSR